MIEIREDEHADEHGLPACNACGTARYLINPENNIAFRCQCKCQHDKAEREKVESQKQQRAMKIEQAKLNSLLGRRYKNVTFENSQIDESNRGIYEKIKDYAVRYKEMLEKGNGFYVYGSWGIGKTHLLACLCNYLTDNLQDCAFTNFLNVAEDIKASFNGKLSEEYVICKYSKVKFLFIDDFGKESYKKLKSETNNGWLDEKIFEILNNRYNNMLPTIFSSNYSPKEMAEKFGFDLAIIDRIVEMSTLIFKMSGDNKRYKNRKKEW